MNKKNNLKTQQLARLIDQTLLRPEATRQEITMFCRTARRYNFATVFVNPCWVKHCRRILRGSLTKVGAAIGFPFGATSTQAKLCEAKTALKDGAQEIDMVINIGALKSGMNNYVFKEFKTIAALGHRHRVGVKVILETCYLSRREIIKACQMARKAGMDFVKTATGFGHTGATVKNVILMRKTVGKQMGVKASGGIRTLQDALKMIKAGATRIGTSAGVEILKQHQGRKR